MVSLIEVVGTVDWVGANFTIYGSFIALVDTSVFVC